MPAKFCYVCKTDVEYEIRDNYDGFTAHGHSSRRVRHLQRDLGRKQRPEKWQTHGASE